MDREHRTVSCWIDFKGCDGHPWHVAVFSSRWPNLDKLLSTALLSISVRFNFFILRLSQSLIRDPTVLTISTFLVIIIVSIWSFVCPIDICCLMHQIFLVKGQGQRWPVCKILVLTIFVLDSAILAHSCLDLIQRVSLVNRSAVILKKVSAF